MALTHSLTDARIAHRPVPIAFSTYLGVSTAVRSGPWPWPTLRSPSDDHAHVKIRRFHLLLTMFWRIARTHRTHCH